MTTSLVTGGLGFIGSHVVDALVDAGHTVIVIDNEETGSRANANPHARYVVADIRDYAAIAPHFARVDYVFHLAALARIMPSFDDPVTFLQTNVAGTINCLLAARAAGVKRFIYTSSSAVFGNDFALPTDETNAIDCLSPYGAGKYEGELYAKIWSTTYDMQVAVLRYFNVYGPRSLNPKDKFNAYSSPVMIFAAQKRDGTPLTITWDGEQKRDYVYVTDVAKANLAAATASLPSNFEIFNIGSGENHTVNEIAAIVGGPTVHIPKRPGEARVTLCDNSKAKRILHWSPQMPFAAGVKATLQAIEDQHANHPKEKHR